MNCDSVREILAVIYPDLRDSDQPAPAAALQHLEQCADCQAFVESRRGFESDATDRELGRAMRNVVVPVDLKSRLLAQVAATSPAIVPNATDDSHSTTIGEPVRPHSPDRSWSRRRITRWLSAVALLLIAFGGGWWFFQLNQKPQLWVENLVALSHAPVFAGTFQQTFRPELPESEILIPPQPKANQAFSLQSDGREIGAIFPYTVGSVRNPLSVVLVVIDLKRVLVLDLKAVGNSFQSAAVYYPKPSHYATKVWRIGESLYVCYVKSSDPNALPRLKTHSVST